MANMLDYLGWYGGLPFDVVPYNEVDAALLAQLSYVALEGIVPSWDEGGEVSLAEVAERLVTDLGKDRIYATPGVVSPLTAMLPQTMAAGRRFSDARLLGLRSILDEETNEQFCAVTIRLGRGVTYVAFRGTDDTLVGWREDFQMTYETVPSQLHAVHYLERVMRGLPDETFDVGGHSKGGNLAVYAAAKASPELKERISAVWNLDGPGFEPSVLTDEELEPVADRIHLIVPAFDVVGQLLERQTPLEVVVSDEQGVQQHDAMSWQVLGPAFVRAEEGTITDDAAAVGDTFERWLGQATPAERREIFGDLFDALGRAGVEGLSDLYSGDPVLIGRIAREVLEVPAESRDYVLNLLGRLMGERARSVTMDLVAQATRQLQGLVEPDADQGDPTGPLTIAEMESYRRRASLRRLRRNLLALLGPDDRHRLATVAAVGGGLLAVVGMAAWRSAHPHKP